MSQKKESKKRSQIKESENESQRGSIGFLGGSEKKESKKTSSLSFTESREVFETSSITKLDEAFFVYPDSDRELTNSKQPIIIRDELQRKDGPNEQTAVEVQDQPSALVLKVKESLANAKNKEFTASQIDSEDENMSDQTITRRNQPPVSHLSEFLALHCKHTCKA